MSDFSNACNCSSLWSSINFGKDVQQLACVIFFNAPRGVHTARWNLIIRITATAHPSCSKMNSRCTVWACSVCSLVAASGPMMDTSGAFMCVAPGNRETQIAESRAEESSFCCLSGTMSVHSVLEVGACCAAVKKAAAEAWALPGAALVETLILNLLFFSIW